MTSLVAADDLASLEGLLLSSRNHYDDGGGAIDELGFSLGLWNGAGDEGSQSGLRIGCGSSDKLGNNVIMDLPLDSELLDSDARASELLVLAAKSWQPDWAGLITKKAIASRTFEPHRPFVDWMVYVPQLIELAPPASRVEVLNGRGSIVVVQPNPPVGDDAEELSRIRQVERLLAVTCP
jgi:hypothetical protein